MKQHRYRVTVEKIRNADGSVPTPPSQFTFEASNHDDMAEIVQKVEARGDLDLEAATSLAVGLKLFSEVMLTHRTHPLFAQFTPHFKDFMKELKSKPTET